jgi:hypothetical protein
VGFDLLSAFKDVQLILQSSSDVRVPLPYANTIRDKFLAAIANDLEKKDWISIYEIKTYACGTKEVKYHFLTLNFRHSLLIAGDCAITLL